MYVSYFSLLLAEVWGGMLKTTTQYMISFIENSTKGKTVVTENRSIVAWDQWLGTMKGHDQTF